MKFSKLIIKEILVVTKYNYSEEGYFFKRVLESKEKSLLILLINYWLKVICN